MIYQHGKKIHKSFISYMSITYWWAKTFCRLFCEPTEVELSESWASNCVKLALHLRKRVSCQQSRWFKWDCLGLLYYFRKIKKLPVIDSTCLMSSNRQFLSFSTPKSWDIMSKLQNPPLNDQFRLGPQCMFFGVQFCPDFCSQNNPNRYSYRVWCVMNAWFCFGRTGKPVWS